MKEIKLTRGMVALVDDEDFEKINYKNWCAVAGGNTFYAARHATKKDNKGSRKLLYMHQEILGFCLIGLETDHKNGNGLDNQRNNLRYVTRRQNQQNNCIQKSSKYPGVYFDKKHNKKKKWRTNIKIRGEKLYLGNFLTQEEAFEAYRIAVEKIGDSVLF